MGQNRPMFLSIAWSFAVVSLALAAAQTAAAPPAPACAEPGSICAEFDAAAAVFVATVVSVSPEPQDSDSRGVRMQTVLFDVTESFKGPIAGPAAVEFNIADPQERRFSAGETVVVYVRGSAKSRQTVSCTRTRRITADDQETTTLRQIVRGLPGGALEGSLHMLEGARPPALPASSLLDHLDVTAESLDGKGSFSVKTQLGGYFLLPWLEPGRYRIKISSDLYAPVARDVVIDARQRCLVLAPVTVQQR